MRIGAFAGTFTGTGLPTQDALHTLALVGTVVLTLDDCNAHSLVCLRDGVGDTSASAIARRSYSEDAGLGLSRCQPSSFGKDPTQFGFRSDAESCALELHEKPHAQTEARSWAMVTVDRLSKLAARHISLVQEIKGAIRLAGRRQPIVPVTNLETTASIQASTAGPTAIAHRPYPGCSPPAALLAALMLECEELSDQ